MDGPRRSPPAAGVTLRPLDDGLIGALLEVAVAEAAPAEVLPPVADPGRFAEAFWEFYSARRDEMHAIEVAGRVVGMIRLTPVADEPGVAETGLWLGRSSRGHGVGRAALAALVRIARERGLQAIVADTTPANPAAVALLRGAGASLTPAGEKVYARLDL